MPFYELSLVLRPMPKKEVLDCLKRVANLVWKESGVLKKIEYMGYNKLPYAAVSKNRDERFEEGSYFLYHVSFGPSKLRDIKPELKLDVDIITAKFNLRNESKLPEDYHCTLEEELLPPALRKSVRPLLEEKNVNADVRR